VGRCNVNAPRSSCGPESFDKGHKDAAGESYCPVVSQSDTTHIAAIHACFLVILVPSIGEERLAAVRETTLPGITFNRTAED
jgi:hypothetical protein